jgi:hypothetical protein
VLEIEQRPALKWPRMDHQRQIVLMYALISSAIGLVVLTYALILSAIGLAVLTYTL